MDDEQERHAVTVRDLLPHERGRHAVRGDDDRDSSTAGVSHVLTETVAGIWSSSGSVPQPSG
jgi:hypothetical protein